MTKTIYSTELQTTITIEAGAYRMTATCADGVFYNAQELKLLNEKKVKTPKQVHLLKKNFNGILIKVG